VPPVAAPVPFTTEEHRHFFAEFIRWETAVGGPDPHLATLGEMVRRRSFAERVWRCGLYASGYNVPTAEVIWQNWPWERMEHEGGTLPAFVQAHWPGGFGLRRERRAVRTAEKFARCLMSIADFTTLVTEERPAWWTERGPEAFEQAWKLTGGIYGLGRYVQLKFVEALARYADGDFFQTDIRASGGQSPREGLALLYPAESEWLLASAGQEVQRTEELAVRLRESLYERDGLEVDFFTLQVVLCEYKKCWQGKQYPGRTHDTELRYLRNVHSYWHNDTDMLRARAVVFRPESLGEISGWDGAREPLENTLPLYRYTWSDLKYDYNKTINRATLAGKQQFGRRVPPEGRPVERPVVLPDVRRWRATA
jgi:hypothetical protein